MLRNPAFSYFVSFLVRLHEPFINKLAPSSDFTIITILTVSLFEIISVVCFARSEEHIYDPKIFIGIALSVFDAFVVNCC